MREKADGQLSDDEIRQALSGFHVPFPDENRIDEAIENLRVYVPAKRNRAVAHYTNLKKLLRETAISVNFMNPIYWIISAFLYATGYFSVIFGFDLYCMIFILSPLPVMIGMAEVFRSRNEKMVEIELSCKFSPQEIAIAKILVTICYNTLLNLALSALLCAQNADAGFIKITLLWFVPMLFSGGLTLLFCARFRGAYAVTASVSVWIVSAAFFAAQGGAVTQFLCENNWAVLVLLCAGVLLFTKEIAAFKNRYYFERRFSFGTDD